MQSQPKFFSWVAPGKPSFSRWAIVLVLLLPGWLLADSSTDRHEILFSAGVGEALESNLLPFGTVDFRFKENWVGIHPYAVGGWTSKGALYLGAGLLYHFNLEHGMRLTVSSGPGYYQHRGDLKNLGNRAEFYSRIELSRALSKGRRLGLSIGHISNGGLGSSNPGSETICLTFSTPVGSE